MFGSAEIKNTEAKVGWVLKGSDFFAKRNAYTFATIANFLTDWFGHHFSTHNSDMWQTANRATVRPVVSSQVGKAGER